MRQYETPRELSYESFIEIFGKEPENKVIGDCKIPSKRRSMFARPREVASSILRTQGTKFSSNTQEITHDSSDSNNNAVHQDQSSNSVAGRNHKETRAERMSRKLRKISLRRRDQKSSNDNKKTPSLHRSKSVSFLGKSPTSNNWFSNFSASVHQRSGRKSPAMESLEPPMSKSNSAAHSGFLSKKNQKKQTWTRYWCILHDCCLYCYSTQTAEFADDVIALGGYSVVSKTSEPKPAVVISLERPGKDSYEFKGDNETAQNAWIEALKKSLVPCRPTASKLRRSTSSVQTTSKKLPPVYERSVSDFCMDVAKVKAKLLEEVLAQQQEIIREQKMLEKLNISRGPSATSSPVVAEKRTKTSSISSLAQSEDHGYCSSLDGSMHDTFSECDDSRQHSPTARSFRSMSTVSVASSASLCSIAEEKVKLTDVCPKVLAEIEDFRNFSKMTIKRRRPRDT